jgi:tRNA G18 (ribose-2'-O)-methylase SpoU
MIKLNARELRTQEPDGEEVKKLKKNPIYIICDSVLDTYNVGAIFRLADAAAVTKVYLCGQTETPPNPKIKKASISTWKWVEWEYAETAVSAISKIKSQISNLKVVCVEQDKKSIAFKDFKPDFPLAIIVGNESFGLSKEILSVCDEIVELPMYGINRSLNVMVSCGIVLYRILEFL